MTAAIQAQIDKLKSRPAFDCPSHGKIWPKQHGEKLCLKRQKANGELVSYGMTGKLIIHNWECVDCEKGKMLKERKQRKRVSKAK